MNTILSKLLGIDRLEGGRIEHWSIRLANLQTPFRWLLFLIALGAAAYGVWWFYKREPEYCARRRKIWMATFRALGLFLLLFILAGPVLELVKSGVSRCKVVLLTDLSRSMDRKDKPLDPLQRLSAAKVLGDLPLDESNPAKISAETAKRIESSTRLELVRALLKNQEIGLLKKLQETYDVELWTFDRAANLAQLSNKDGKLDEDVLKEAKAEGPVTEIGSAIHRLADRMRGHPLAGFILLSDGGNNKGEEPTAAVDDLGVPVLPIGFGIPGAKDVAISYIFMEKKIFIDDPAPVEVRLRHNGYAGQAVEMAVTLNGEQMARKTVTLSPTGEQTEIIRVKPKRPGVFTLRVEVPSLPGEVEASNNAREQEVEVIDKKIKVLIVEQDPRWEYRYIKNAMARDKRVEVKILLRIPDRHEQAGAGALYLKEFPKREDLFKYDCIVFGNMPNDNFWTGQDLENIHRFVTQEGGGIFFIADKNNFPDTYKDSKLESLIPVEFDPEPPVTGEEEKNNPLKDGFRLALTPDGRTHSLTRLQGSQQNLSDEEHSALWELMPEIFWYHKATRPKMAATVLLDHSGSSRAARFGDREHRAPILVTARVGRGRVVYSAIRDFWRMRYPLELGPDTLDTFYGHIIQYLGLGHCLGRTPRIELKTDREDYAVGDTIKVSAYILEKGTYEKSTQERVPAVATDLENEAQHFPIDLTPVAGQPGRFQGELTAKFDGKYRVTLKDEAEEDAHSDYRVRMPQLELDSPELKKDVLDAIAKASVKGEAAARAHMYYPDQAGEILEELKQTKDLPPSRLEDPLWDAPLMVILFTLFMGAEWLVRKRSDLI